MTDTEIKKADLIVSGGIVLPMDAGSATTIPEGFVAIRGDRIAAVGPAAEISRWRAARTIDAQGGIIMPGLINTHTHAAMTLFRGLADDLPLMTWLNDHIFPAEARLSPDKVKAGAMLACAEMIASGTTCFCDMYLFEDAVAEAARAAGMRALVGEVLFDFPSPSYGNLENGFACTRDLIQKWESDPLIQVAVEPHSPYLCAPDLLIRAFKLASDHRTRMVIHLSETESEVVQIQGKYDRTPVAHLAGIGVLGPHVLACHCVVMTEADLALLKTHDVKVAHNPESNMKLASGVAPVPRMLDMGIRVGLGTDGCASNNDLDLFGEMDTAAKIHKVVTRDPTVMSAATVLRMATIDAARSLGLEARIGALTPGKQADIIVVDTRSPHMTPLYDPISHLVYAASGSDVRYSIIAGRVVFDDRIFTTLDVDQVMADARRIATEIR